MEMENTINCFVSGCSFKSGEANKIQRHVIKHNFSGSQNFYCTYPDCHLNFVCEVDTFVCHYLSHFRFRYSDMELMVRKATHSNLSNEINAIINQLSDNIENTRKESKIKIINHNNQDHISDPLSINHIPQNTIKALEFIELLTDKYLLRDLDIIDKGIDELCETLRDYLIK